MIPRSRRCRRIAGASGSNRKQARLCKKSSPSSRTYDAPSSRQRIDVFRHGGVSRLGNPARISRLDLGQQIALITPDSLTHFQLDQAPDGFHPSDDSGFPVAQSRAGLIARYDLPECPI